MTKSQLRELQDRKLRLIFKHAYNNVPFYHRRFRSAGLTPENILSLDDIKRIPTLTRQDVYLNSSEIVASGKDHGKLLNRITSGTTGRPLRILWDKTYSDIMTALNLRTFANIGMKPWDKAASIIYDAGIESKPWADRKKRFSNFMQRLNNVTFGSMTVGHLPGLRVQTLVIRPGGDVKVAHALFDLKPSLIYSRPSYLRRLAYILRDENRQMHPERVVVGSEFISRGCVKELQDLYQAKVYQGCGSNEFGGLGCECEFISGMHLNSDHFVFEILREGEPVSPGEAGEVVITGLHNMVMPLIRYRIGDVAVLGTEERCDCGSSLPRLKEIQGRITDGLVSSEKMRITTAIVVDYLESVLGLRDYQLIQMDRERVLVRLKPKFNTPNITETLLAYLNNLLGCELHLEIEVLKQDDLPEKYRPVVSQITPDPQDNAPTPAK